MWFRSLIIVFMTISLLTSACKGANILFFFAVSTYSHRVTVWPLVEALVDKGHSVTFLQPYENKNPNHKVIEIVPKVGKISVDFIQMRHGLGPVGQAVLLGGMLPIVAPYMCGSFLNDPEMIKWINSTIKYDIVIIDSLMNDCALGLAYKWKAKTIIFGVGSVFEWWPDAFGFPAESSWIPNIHSGYLARDVPLPFLDRILPTLAHLYMSFAKSFMFHQKVEPMLREKLNLPDMPALSELESNVSLVLMNSHFSEEFARSLPPLVVPVGGIQCTDKIQPLPKVWVCNIVPQIVEI